MANVDSDIKDWSATASSNKPTGSTAIGTSLDDDLRQIQATVVAALSQKGADIASAGTTDLGAVAGFFHDITGTTTITSFGTVRAGVWKVIKFEGALTLTHNATSLILPGGANITTANGDTAIVHSEGSGNWRCSSYVKTSGAPLLVATQALQEAGASAVAAVTPSVQQYHPSAAKAFCKVNNAGTISGTSYNISSVTDTATGIATFNFTTSFTNTGYAVVATLLSASVTVYAQTVLNDYASSSSARVDSVDAGTLTQTDPAFYVMAAFGDQ